MKGVAAASRSTTSAAAVQMASANGSISPFAGRRGAGLFLGLIGEVQVFEALVGIGLFDLLPQFGGQLSLGIDQPQNGGCPFGQLSQGRDSREDW